MPTRVRGWAAERVGDIEPQAHSHGEALAEITWQSEITRP